ncbi:hypothetical protein CLOM_g12914 [Closterium sp. NIES-68]|nr:hypothetical protein CLOM_g12914 [Closterium sp. NIES-68]GJP83171.1 hypothetical protein CLOP_g13364 [Closterium sp. NIES-67]
MAPAPHASGLTETGSSTAASRIRSTPSLPASWGAMMRPSHVCQRPAATLLLSLLLLSPLTVELLPAAAAASAVSAASSRGGPGLSTSFGARAAAARTWRVPQQLLQFRNLAKAVTVLREQYAASREGDAAGVRKAASTVVGAEGTGEGGGETAPLGASGASENDRVGVTAFANVAPQEETDPNAPYTVFEVAKPIERPQGAEECTVTLFTDEPFANTIGNPPTQASYTPDPNCASADWSLAVLSVGVKVKGVQFDRRMVIFFGGFEVSRSITAEPLGTEIHYSFERDVTSYTPMLKTASTVYVILENVVDADYTGIFNVTISLTTYKGTPLTTPPSLLLPFSTTSSSSSSPFILSGASPTTRSASVSLSGLPANVIKAKVELTISMHADDEFYYLYFPNKFYNSLPSSLKPKFKPEGGPFRELELYIDNRFAGAIYPFAPLYTGAFNPLLWSPAVGIGNFGIPSITLDVTPFAGVLSDGQAHEIKVTVGNAKAAAAWYLTGIVHIWVDSGVASTAGPPPTIKVSPSKRKERVKLSESPLIRVLRMVGVRLSIDGKYGTVASRAYTITGTVTTSDGPVTTQVTSSLSVDAAAVVAQGGVVITWWNNVGIKTSVTSTLQTTAAVLATQTDSYTFPLKLKQTSLDSYGSVKFDIDSGYNRKSTLGGTPIGSSASSSSSSSAVTTNRLHNSRKDGFTVYVDSKGVVTGSSTSGSQRFVYKSSLGSGCYSRQIKTRPIEVLQNVDSASC